MKEQFHQHQIDSQDRAARFDGLNQVVREGLERLTERSDRIEVKMDRLTENVISWMGSNGKGR